jgi:hypothetical protein
MRYSDLLLFKLRGITNDEDMHMLIYNIKKFDGYNTWEEIIAFDEDLALQIIDWIEDLNIDLQTKHFLKLNNIPKEIYNDLWDISIYLMYTIIFTQFWAYPQDEETDNKE